ncbi:hypothetical protein SHO565_42270 [Streptomyces sp. HO565]
MPTAGSPTGYVVSGEPVEGPDRPPGHEVVAPRMAAGTFKTEVDGRLPICHPDDVPGAVLHPDPRRAVVADGPHLVCGGCGVEVATKESDCCTGNLVAVIVSAVTKGAQDRR